jgi:hypothetical protein
MDKINQRFGRDGILIGMTPSQARSFSGSKIAFTRIPNVNELLEKATFKIYSGFHFVGGFSRGRRCRTLPLPLASASVRCSAKRRARWSHSAA